MRWICWLFLFPGYLLGQAIDISGYFEPQFTGIHLNNTVYQLVSNKVRIDVARVLSDRVSFAANYNYITYHGKTQWRIADYLPGRIADKLLIEQKNNLIFNFGDMLQSIGPLTVNRPERFYLDNAYLQLSFKNADITVGRQQISLGTGYTWNPTDLFNIKNILDPTYEQPGHNAIRVDIPVGLSSSLTALYSPGEQWKNSAKLLKFKTTLGRFDLSAITILTDWDFTDFHPIIPQKGDYYRTMFGGDLAGELLGLGVWAEAGFNKISHRAGADIGGLDDFVEIVAGADYTLKSGIYLMGEWYRNSLAPSNWRNYTINNWIWYFDATIKTIGRDQLLLLGQYPLTDFVNAGLMTIASLSDQSAAIVPTLTWSLFQDVELLMYGNFYTGREGRSFSSNLGNGGLLRLRAYF